MKKNILNYYFIKTYLLNYSSYLNKISDLFDVQFYTQQVNIYEQIFLELIKTKPNKSGK